MATKGPIGRHVIQITPQMLEIVEKGASKLYSKTQLAACIHMTLDTFLDKLKNYPSLAEAYERGWAKGLITEAEKIERVEEALYRNATEPALNGDGAPVGPQGGDTKAQMFILKAKAGWSDQKVEISGNPDKPILIAPLFAANYQKELDRFTKVIDAPDS